MVKYVRKIGAVFGQKSQLIWDIPPIDSFAMNKAIYGISDEEYKERLIKYFVEHLGYKRAEELMRKRGDDWMEFYEEGYTVEETGCGMIMNLL